MSPNRDECSYDEDDEESGHEESGDEERGDEEWDDEDSVWQREDARCAVVLNEVFEWLRAQEVLWASAVCRAWRRAAAAPALWRRLLQRDARLSHAHLLTLAPRHVSWYEEYWKTFMGWDRVESVPCSGGGGVGVVDAALDPGARSRLALLTDDAALTVWETTSSNMVGWSARWRYELRTRGWSGGARLQWAGSRLLLAGPLALVDYWELLVIQLDDDEDTCGHVVSSTRCSAGAAGCWADVTGDAFLSFELNSFAPSVACTTVWLNSATQETQSEHTGVRAPLFRIYNEPGEHLTMAAVIDTPLDIPPRYADAKDDRSTDDVATDLCHCYTIQKEVQEEIKMRVLVTTSGCRDREGGAVCAWGLSASRPPDVRAAARGDLRERVRRAAAAPPPPAAPPAAPPAPPAPHEVRALCTPPDDTCALPAPPVGLAPHHSGRCVWVSLGSGEVWCLSSPTLQLLRRLVPDDNHPNISANGFLFYVRLAVSDEYVASPSVRGGVSVWRAASGGAAPVTSLPALAAPALLALLPRRHAHMLLVFTTDTMHHDRLDSLVWHEARPSRVRQLTGHTHDTMAFSSARYYKILSQKIQPQLQRTCLRSTSKSCDGVVPGAAPAPCEPAPRPSCRPPPPSAARRAERLACCPPPRARRPPCPASPPAAPRTCANVSKTHRPTSSAIFSSERCGDRQDKVAVRLAAAEAARRAEYEREASEGAGGGAGGGGARAAPLSLGEQRHCSRATDGRVYVLPGPPEPLAACGPRREPPPPHPPHTLLLQPDDACRVNVDRYLDPCAHRPRKFVEIARGPDETPSMRSPAPGIPSDVDRKSKNRTRSKSDNSPCVRSFHSSTAFNTATRVTPEGIDAMLLERANLKEAGRGRMVTCESNPSPRTVPPRGGHLEMEVPPGTDRVSVRVVLSTSSTACRPSLPDRSPAPATGTILSSRCTQNVQSISVMKPCPSIPERKGSWVSSKCISQKLSTPNETDDTVKGKRGKEGPCKQSPPPPPRPQPPQRPSCPPSSPPRELNSASDKKPGCSKNISKFLPFVLSSV